jgi:hypothetical protein
MSKNSLIRLNILQNKEDFSLNPITFFSLKELLLILNYVIDLQNLHSRKLYALKAGEYLETRKKK